jgi:Flp pilus assembly protein TadG
MPRLTRNTSRSRRPRSRGQSLVEFALVLPVFLMILSGIMDMGFLLYSRMTVINAAREGARVATIMTEESGAAIGNAITGQVNGAANGLTVTTCAHLVGSGCGALGGADAGDSFKVTVTHTYHPFFPLLIGTTIPISSTVQMVFE